jgi:alginate O-acetyltransferase complex protein AlgI
MLFNSLQFLVSFVIVTIAFFLLPHKYRWFLLLAYSCYFYMAFIPLYILILGFTIVIDYFAGIWIENAAGQKRKWFLIISLFANIFILAVFKYYNFLNLYIERVLSLFSYHTPLPHLSILLPIGLSFHTFQAMSYTIEVYRGNQKAEKHFGIYALYVMFYPQLVAGPIERPQNILWQFHQHHAFDFEKFKSGLLQMAFGFFKKVVIADRLALVVDYCYTQPETKNGSTLLIAAVFYSFQIYCDFSGYSDIAIGAARMMGFKLMDNFNTPYLSKSVAEFWKRWHISLSTWFRDYLYISLGGNRVSVPRWYFNLFFVFMVSGLWHGAGTNFIIWGALHGIFLIIALEKDKLLETLQIKIPHNFFTKLVQISFTFGLVTLAWIFFRATDIPQALIILTKIIQITPTDKLVFNLNTNEVLFSGFLIFILLLKEKYFLQIPTQNTLKAVFIFLLIVANCYFFGVFDYKQFIYFQF